MNTIVPAWQPPLHPSITPPGVSPNTRVSRGFPDGVSTGRPAPGKGILVIEKIVITEDSPPFSPTPRNPQDFRIDVRGPNGFLNLNPSLQGSGVIEVNPGLYSVFEIVANGYLPIAYMGDCRDADIRAGDTKRCTIWNRPMQGYVTSYPSPIVSDRGNMVILIYVIYDSGGAQRPVSDFNPRLTINGNPVTLPTPYVQSIGPFVREYVYELFGIPTGTYRLTNQNTHNDYLPPTFIPSSSGTLARGELKHVYMVNNDRYR